MMRLFIIIPADTLDVVRTAAAGVFGDVARLEFVEAGSPTGDSPATHWWLSGLFTESEMSMVAQLLPMFPSAVLEQYDMASNPSRPFEKLQEMGLVNLKPAALQ